MSPLDSNQKSSAIENKMILKPIKTIHLPETTVVLLQDNNKRLTGPFVHFFKIGVTDILRTMKNKKRSTFRVTEISFMECGF